MNEKQITDKITQVLIKIVSEYEKKNLKVYYRKSNIIYVGYLAWINLKYAMVGISPNEHRTAELFDKDREYTGLANYGDCWSFDKSDLE